MCVTLPARAEVQHNESTTGFMEELWTDEMTTAVTLVASRICLGKSRTLDPLWGRMKEPGVEG